MHAPGRRRGTGLGSRRRGARPGRAGVRPRHQRRLHLARAAAAAVLAREWLFLAYAVFAAGKGVGLYYLTQPAGAAAVWGLAAFSSGILVGVVQDATMVAFVQQFPAEYGAADPPTRLVLESLGRTVTGVVGVQQAVSNVLLGVGVALYSGAILRPGVASKWFGLSGFLAAAVSIFFGAVTAAPPPR